jgi:hypothetical protein
MTEKRGTTTNNYLTSVIKPKFDGKRWRMQGKSWSADDMIDKAYIDGS